MSATLEVQPAGALAARGGDQAQGTAIEEQARPARRSGAAAAPCARAAEASSRPRAATHAVEVLAGLEHAHEQLPLLGRRPSARARGPRSPGEASPGQLWSATSAKIG